MKYLIEDTNKIVDERELRRMLIEEETEDIINNIDDYVDGNFDLGNQLHCIDTAKNGNIEKIIKMLGNNWNIPVKVVNENKYNALIILDTKISLEDYSIVKTKIKEIIENNVFNEIGKRKLAYKIKDNEEGFFLEFKFESVQEKITELERYFRLEDNIIKFMILKEEEKL